MEKRRPLLELSLLVLRLSVFLMLYLLRDLDTRFVLGR
jgi:hypothetical protein